MKEYKISSFKCQNWIQHPKKHTDRGLGHEIWPKIRPITHIFGIRDQHLTPEKGENFTSKIFAAE